jgi:hypothetical protein
MFAFLELGSPRGLNQALAFFPNVLARVDPTRTNLVGPQAILKSVFAVVANIPGPYSKHPRAKAVAFVIRNCARLTFPRVFCTLDWDACARSTGLGSAQ